MSGTTKGSSPRRRGRSQSRDNSKRRTHSNARSSTGGSHAHKSTGSKNNTWNSAQLNDLFKSVIKGAATTVGAKFTSGLGSSSPGEEKAPSGNVGEFDLYLFAQTWAPRFCCTNNDKCKDQDKAGVDDLTVHGLWPAYEAPNASGRTYPAFCIIGSARKFSTTDKLASHEFIKHGSCTKMSFDEYMSESLKLEETEGINNMRDYLNSNAGEIVSITDIFEEAGGPERIAIQATPYCQLQELTTCWKKAVDGTVGEQIDCPSHVLGSSRNSAVLNKCTKVSLEASNDSMSCSFISKELLKIMKS